MRFFSRWNGKSLKPAWDYGAKGILWRLLPTENGYFVGEDRDAEAKAASFFCLEAHTGIVCWEGIQFDEKWWIGMEAVHKDVLILHEYAAPDMPDHKKILAVDMLTGKLLWRNDDVKFHLAYDDRVYAIGDEHTRRAFFGVDLHTGEVVGEVDAPYLNVLKETMVSREVGLVEFPKSFEFAKDNNSILGRRILSATAGSENLDRAEYITKNGIYIVGYYENLSANPADQLLRQHLAILDEDTSRIIYRDIMSVQSSTRVPDLFFGRGDFVYYIKDKKLLKAVKLHLIH